MRFELKKQIWLTLICFILGILLATSFVTQQASQATLPSPRKVELIEVIRDLEKERDKLKAKLQEQREQLTAYEKRAAADEGVLASFNRELEKLRFAAGISAVKGPGIIVTIGDSTNIPPNKNPNDYIVHDTDLRVLVNALWSSGAEAITVNNERIVSLSAIRCAGTMILLNSKRLASPYKIKAIGSPENLLKGLRRDFDADRLLNEVAKTFGLIVAMEKQSDLVLPAFKSSLRLEHAKITEAGER